MTRKDAIKAIDEIFESDSMGFRDSFTDEQDAAIRLALVFLKNPECACCGYCKRFDEEGGKGFGWCEKHDREANGKDRSCGYYEYGGAKWKKQEESW